MVILFSDTPRKRWSCVKSCTFRLVLKEVTFPNVKIKELRFKFSEVILILSFNDNDDDNDDDDDEDDGEDDGDDDGDDDGGVRNVCWPLCLTLSQTTYIYQSQWGTWPLK